MNSNNEEEAEVLASRGFDSSYIRLRAFSSHGYRDRSRDVLSAVDIWDLELKILIKDKEWRDSILSSYPLDRLPILGSNHQVMMIPKDRHYYDNQLLYVPIRLTGKRYHHIPESELGVYEQESKDEGVFWMGEITGNIPTRELLEKVSPTMESCVHLFTEDTELNERSAINNDVQYNLENVEVYFKPIRDCKRWDCPLCQPVQKFLESHRKANKKARDWFLIGRTFDDKESIKFDHLKGLEPFLKQFELLTKMIQVNNAIFDSWDKLDGKTTTTTLDN